MSSLLLSLKNRLCQAPLLPANHCHWPNAALVFVSGPGFSKLHKKEQQMALENPKSQIEF